MISSGVQRVGHLPLAGLGAAAGGHNSAAFLNSP
jgi:hypothetical protein